MAGLVVIDQLVKLWALRSLRGHEPIQIIKNVLQLLYVENRGAAFGMLQNRQWFFLIITAVVILGLILIIPRIPDEKKYRFLNICLVFLGAGAIGNMIDRAFRKYVVDFIYFKLIDFPVFNVADIYVTCATFALVLLIFFYYKEEDINRIFSKKEAKKDEEGS